MPDFTLTFRRLSDAAACPEGDEGMRALFTDPGVYDAWATGWRRRLQEEPVAAEARIAMLRRAKASRVLFREITWSKQRWKAATEAEDFQPFEELLQIVTQPYEDRPGLERYSAPARPEECVIATFCGT